MSHNQMGISRNFLIIHDSVRAWPEDQRMINGNHLCLSPIYIYIYTYYNIHKVIYYTYIYIHTYCIYNITLYIYIESMNEANEAWLPFLCYSRGSVQWFTTRVRWPAGLGLLVPSQERRCLRLSTGRPCLFLEALFGRSKTMLEYVPTHTLW